jgi:hypothetical protein
MKLSGLKSIAQVVELEFKAQYCLHQKQTNKQNNNNNKKKIWKGRVQNEWCSSSAKKQ